MRRAIHVSRQDIEQFEPPEDCLIISITDPSSPPARIPENPRIRCVHRVEPFHDVDAQITERFLLKRKREIANAKAAVLGTEMPYILYDEPRALALAQFIKRHTFVDLAPTLCVVHCEAGISRSAAVAGALQYHFRMDQRPDAFKTGIPNMHVYRLTALALIEVMPRER